MDADIVEVFCGYACSVMPVNYSLCPEDLPHPSGDPYFTMTVIRNKLYYKVPHMDLNGDKSTTVTIPIRRISKNRMRLITETMLSAFEIPEPDHNSMATKILDVADNMLNDTHKNDKILNVAVLIDVHIYYHHSDNYNQALAALGELQHYDNNNNNGLVPASDSSIEGLERVELEQVQGLPHCVICLGVFKVGREIIRMPCSHFFHRNCIVHWLHRKNECPLCRFELPTSDH